METFWMWMLALAAVLAAPRVKTWLRERRQRPAPLCASCAWSHIERGARAREVSIFCFVGQTLRPLRFPVRECSHYRNGRLPARAPAGFMRAGDVAPSGRALARR